MLSFFTSSLKAYVAIDPTPCVQYVCSQKWWKCWTIPLWADYRILAKLIGSELHPHVWNNYTKTVIFKKYVMLLFVLYLMLIFKYQNIVYVPQNMPAIWSCMCTVTCEDLFQIFSQHSAHTTRSTHMAECFRSSSVFTIYSHAATHLCFHFHFHHHAG